MGGCNFDQEQIRTALHAQARSFDPPTDLKQQIDARLACQNQKEVIHMKHRNMKKIAAVAAVACMLTGTVCVAAVKHSGYFSISSSSELNEVSSFPELAKLEKQTGIQTNAKESLHKDFAFASANVTDIDAMDENFEQVIDSFHEVKVLYEKDGKQLWYSVRETPLKFTEESKARSQAIESDGITYRFSQSNYLFLPEDKDITPEDKAREEAGELFISIGSSQREEEVSTSLSWNVNGQGYMLSGMDLDLTADDLIAIAAEMK